ncbi:hypothetical protein GEMRC1_013640 [Eukaryota sp. GEM-RC1]
MFSDTETLYNAALSIGLLTLSVLIAVGIIKRRSSGPRFFSLCPSSLPLKYPEVPKHMEEAIQKEINQPVTVAPDLIETPAKDFGVPHSYFENVHLPTAVLSSIRYLEAVASSHSPRSCHGS